MLIKEYKDREKYDQRHGGPFDRGSADSWYSRPFDPHYYSGDTGTSNRILAVMMTQDQLEAYAAGYEHNEKFGDKKSWD